MRQVVSISWRSSTMPAPAIAYYHRDCASAANLPNAHLREVALEDVASGATCKVCGHALVEDEAKAQEKYEDRRKYYEHFYEGGEYE